MATVHETYAAALQHDRAELPDGTQLVGVVRRPMGWFHGAVDENVPALGPPAELLDAVKDRQAALEDGGSTMRRRSSKPGRTPGSPTATSRTSTPTRTPGWRWASSWRP